MEKKTQNILITVFAVAGVAYLISLAAKYRKASKEKKSNLVDDMLENMGKPISQFTITNKGKSAQKISLFKIYEANTNDKREITINPSIGFFNKSLLNDPKKIVSIKVSVNKSPYAQTQATQLFTKVCQDANGEGSTSNYFPMVSTSQYQSNMTEIRPDDLILDGVCYLDYTVQPETAVTLILEYKTEYKSGRSPMSNMRGQACVAPKVWNGWTCVDKVTKGKPEA